MLAKMRGYVRRGEEGSHELEEKKSKFKIKTNNFFDVSNVIHTMEPLIIKKTIEMRGKKYIKGISLMNL